ncbi:MAG: hypothetical protein HYW25_04825 [Candidatus Aenigmarchaeota archaeon]|nr:hypothetical protein [Candidatus Aenigmarchaeota archaeon]
MAESEFMYGLVGGLMILGLLLLVFNTTWAMSFDGDGNDAGEAQKGLVVVINGRPVLIPAGDDQRVVAVAPGDNEVGTRFEDSSIFSILGSFDISSEPEMLSFPGGTLKNGLLFGEESMRFVAENPRKIRVFITNENDIGDFIMLVNGNVFVKERLAAGIHEFLLSESGETQIELRAESSEWKIWAPTLYEIASVEIQNTKSADYFTFSADPERFHRGTLEFDFSENSGTIDVELNGQAVYRGATGQRLVVPLNSVPAQNTAVIRALDGEFRGTASALEIDRDKFVKTFDIEYSVEDKARMPGWIAFDLIVLQPGSLVVRNIHKNGESLITAEAATSGFHLLQLRGEHVSEGVNKLVFEGAGDGLFLIRDLHVVD